MLQWRIFTGYLQAFGSFFKELHNSNLPISTWLFAQSRFVRGTVPQTRTMCHVHVDWAQVYYFPVVVFFSPSDLKIGS